MIQILLIMQPRQYGAHARVASFIGASGRSTAGRNVDLIVGL
jgi:hypothetical protein